MSLVTRGLGLGGILVTAGLALNLGVIVVPPTPAPPPLESWNTLSKQHKVVKTNIAATISVPAVKGRGLLADIDARGAAKVKLYVPEQDSEVGSFRPSGAAKATIIGVSSETELGKILASGEHDMSDEDILAMILSLLEVV